MFNLFTYYIIISQPIIIKASGNDSWAQEETVCMSLGLRDYYGELFTWMATLNF